MSGERFRVKVEMEKLVLGKEVINLYHGALQNVVVPGSAALASLRNFLDRQTY